MTDMTSREGGQDEVLVQRVNELICQLTKPTYVYRMARSLVGHHSDSMQRSATTRIGNAAREIDDIVRSYVTGRLETNAVSHGKFPTVRDWARYRSLARHSSRVSADDTCLEPVWRDNDLVPCDMKVKVGSLVPCQYHERHIR